MAIERVRALHKAEGKNAMPREAMVKHLGFSSLNGASSTLISALSKFGLVDSAGDGEVRVSDLAMRIIYPHDASERQEALEEAAFRPTLFQEIREKWPDRPPSEESLRPFLVRKGFSESALDQVIRFYRETSDMVQSGSQPHDAPSRIPAKEHEVHSPAGPSPAHAQPGQPLMAPPTAGRPFAIAFDGSTLTGTLALRSARDIDRLMKVLSAQKAAFEAMEDEDDFEADKADDGAGNRNSSMS